MMHHLNGGGGHQAGITFNNMLMLVYISPAISFRVSKNIVRPHAQMGLLSFNLNYNSSLKHKKKKSFDLFLI